MVNDIYYNPTKILFGKAMEEKVGEETARYSKNILLHYGSDRIKKSGLFDRIVTSLQKAGVRFTELGGVVSNPRSGLVYQGIEICKKNNLDFILAVGGGSVIDSAKAIGYGVKYEGDFMDLYLGKAMPSSCLPIGTVLTIPGAGSESSNGSVITDEGLGLKRSCDTDLARPVFSIMNPELTVTVPLYNTLAGAFDAIVHVMERYFTTTRYVDVSDRMCEGLMRSMMKYMPLVKEDPENYDIRAEIMWGCKIAQDGTIGVGREESWVSHLLQRDIGSIAFDSSHGAGLAVVTPAWMRFIYKKDIPRFAQWAERVMDVELDPFHLEIGALEGIERFEAFIRSVDLPTHLSEVGVNGMDDVMRMADKAFSGGNGTLGGYHPISRRDFIDILQSVL